MVDTGRSWRAKFFLAMLVLFSQFSSGEASSTGVVNQQMGLLDSFIAVAGLICLAAGAIEIIKMVSR